MPQATTQTQKSHFSTADHGTVLQAQVQLQRCAKALESMSDSVADAKQIKEYDSDRRKRSLADVMAVLLDGGESAAAAECKARASKAYGDALIHLGVQYREALRVIERYEAQRILWESSRSLLSMERAKVSML